MKHANVYSHTVIDKAYSFPKLLYAKLHMMQLKQNPLFVLKRRTELFNTIIDPKYALHRN